MTVFEDLQYRGLIKDLSDEKLIEKLNNESLTFYIGTDPTGDSLHIGHLVSFLICERLKRYGHHPIILIGGATGLIGDPKPDAERPVISKETVDYNFNSLKTQIENIFGCEVVNNYDWSKDINFIDFLRDYGKYFPIGYMLNKDIVKRRMKEGMTYTEFSYMIMQSLDFLHLYENKNCILQVAGQDQWGNITAGIELIRKKTNKDAYAFTMPLLLKKDGTKFGKTAAGQSVWLKKERTSVYDFYQFFYNVEDASVIEYLKKFTFLTKEEIDSIEEEQNKHPEERLAQKTLAFEITSFVHGKEEAEKVKEESERIFKEGNIENAPVIELNLEDKINILDLLVETKLCPSKSEARRLVIQGGIKINKEKIEDPNYLVDTKEIVIQKGKKTFLRVIKIN